MDNNRRCEGSNMEQCGLCSLLSGLMRRAMCVGSRRGSNDTYYRELGDQDTLKIEDKTSEVSVEVAEMNQEVPTSSQITEDHPELNNMTLKALHPGSFHTIHRRRKKRLHTRTLCVDAALIDDLHVGLVQCILDQSMQWKFNAFTLENVSGGRCLPVLCVHLFHVYGLISHFRLDATKAWKLFSLIEEGYHSSNPYHNSIHAADVTQAMHCFLQQKQIRDHLEPLEIMACLLAAIAHDLDHPGVNQPFLVATSNHLAALYKNTSVLENHHWRSAIGCLIESGLLDQFASDKPKQERDALMEKLGNQISSLILATDITKQQEYLSQFKNYLDTNTLDMTKSEHRHLVLQIALKCADISNPCRSWEISSMWSLKVCEEFFRQGDYERKLNIPITYLCDRNASTIPKIQTGFFKYVVTPLITEWHRFLQNDLSQQMLKNLLFNQKNWEILFAQEITEETCTEISDADLVDDDLETCCDTNMSDSSEMLLPLRRSSLNPTKQSALLKEQIRRLSVPLNVFQDTKFKTKDKTRAPSLADSRIGSENSQLNVRGHCDSVEQNTEEILTTEHLLPDVSIALITTPIQAMRLNSVMKDSSWKLVRQQTFPPLVPMTCQQPQPSHNNYVDDAILTPRCKAAVLDRRLDQARKEFKYCGILKKNDEKIDDAEVTDNNATGHASPSEKEIGQKTSGKKEELGSQLRENLSSVKLDTLGSDQMQQRRKSMPAEVAAYTLKEKKMVDVSAIPDLLRRTLSGKEFRIRRRGSAPAPVAPSELRSLAPAAASRNNANGARRKVNPLSTCHQWLAKATSLQERSFQQLPRRSSLPAEVMTGISSH